jgi:hypothetical protein
LARPSRQLIIPSGFHIVLSAESKSESSERSEADDK